MIEICGLTKRFRRKIALNHVDYKLDCGIYGLLGPNGAGKTTLMRCMANLYRFSSGDVRLDGESIRKKRGYGALVGYLPQKFGLFQELTVMEMMEYFSVLKKTPRNIRGKEIEKCLEVVNLLDKRNLRVSKLSGGMVRRVGIAQTLLSNPPLVLLDEPTSGLDPEERMRFKSIISNIGKDTTVIISTHIVEDVEACCNHVIIMNSGEIIMGGTCAEIQNMARGKVCEMKKERVGDLGVPYYIEKEYEKDDQTFCRVISSAISDYDKQEPTTEDGYLCLLKNI